MVTRDTIIEVLKTVEDPELFLDIWFLGLIYSITITPVEGDADGNVDVEIEMTFTSPMCPAGPQLIEEVKSKVGGLIGVRQSTVRVTFSPPWEPSDEVKGMLGMM
jgi:metal-sulfur cluster biosynthetic enzyme